MSKEDVDQIVMTTRQVERLLLSCVPARQKVLIVSAPGIGKSAITEQTAEALGYDLIILHPVVSDPTDFKGMPWVQITDGKAQAAFIPFNDLKRICDATEPTMVFFDDIGQAPPAVQAALMQLLHAKRLNGHRIPDEVIFIGATNRKEDKAGVRGMLEPVKSRWETIVHMIADPDDWAMWAIKNDISTEIVTFCRKHRPELLHKFVPTSGFENSPCPRGWEHLDSLFKLKLDTDLELAAYAGAVGRGPATEFMGYLKIYRKLELPENILNNPKSARIPEDPSVLWATVGALSRKAGVKTMPAIVEYANRLSDEFSVLLVKDCTAIDEEVLKTRAMMEWAAKHSEVVLG